MSYRAEVALPEVQHVHVVRDRLPAFDLEENAAVADRQEVVRPEAPLIVREEAVSLVSEAQSRRELQKGGLHGRARGPRAVRKCDGCLRGGRV